MITEEKKKINAIEDNVADINQEEISVKDTEEVDDIENIEEYSAALINNWDDNSDNDNDNDIEYEVEMKKLLDNIDEEWASIVNN